jgi:hypothetical protein
MKGGLMAEPFSRRAGRPTFNLQGVDELVKSPETV